MTKAILIPVLVGACALFARADVAYPMVDSALKFGTYGIGQTNIHTRESPITNWHVPSDTALTQTRKASKSLLAVECSIEPDESLFRTIISRAQITDPVSNAWITCEGEGGYDGFYFDTTVRLPYYDVGQEPKYDDDDRFVLWARSDGIHVTAGRFENDTRNVVRHDYRLASPAVPAANQDVAVTIRVFPEIIKGSKTPGFALWINKVHVQAVDNPFPVVDFDQLVPEANAIAVNRGLFPAMVKPDSDKAYVLSGIGFSGNGSVGNLTINKNSPYPETSPSRIFTLRWDAGVKNISYKIGTSASVAVPAEDISRRTRAIEIPTSETEIKIVATYNNGGYSQGFWTSEGSCSILTNGNEYSFHCAVGTEPCSGYVRSFRNEITLAGGNGAYARFSDAKRQALMQGSTAIVLGNDFSPVDEETGKGDAISAILIEEGEKVTIDLKGHSITNPSGEFPTIINRGELTIMDSSAAGTGRVASHLGVVETNDFLRVAIDSHTDEKFCPKLTIEGGTFDGVINVDGCLTNAVGTVFKTDFSIRRSVAATGIPAFRSDNGERFEFEDVVENDVYFAYDGSYWKPLGSTAFIWCGANDDHSWFVPDNWKDSVVPGAGDTVVFPYSDTPWSVDLDNVVLDNEMFVAGDVVFTDSADFTNVRFVDVQGGRISGDAELTWKGKLPGDFSSLLSDEWSGKFIIVDVGHTSPKILTDLATWGNPSSEVVFRGVRGYYHEQDYLAVPYTLRLENGSNGYAWQNDAGFTGGIIEFSKLVGDGRFFSPRNTIANRQVIIFRDVLDYTGELEVKGKRIVLGPGEVATIEAGSITWSDGVQLKAGAVHDCRVAAFGGAMDFYGLIGDTLTTYDKDAGRTEGIESEAVTIRPSAVLAELYAEDGVIKVAAWSENATYVDGRRQASANLLSANSQTSIRAMSVESARRLSFASYYDAELSTNADCSISVRLKLNQNAIPVIGAQGDETADISFADGMVSIVISDAPGGLWYGLEYKPALDSDWSSPVAWETLDPLNGGKIQLQAPAEELSGFYRVVVTDINPKGGGK